MTTRRRIAFSILSLWLFASCTIQQTSVPERMVRVKVLADSAIQDRDPGWRSGVRQMVETASAFYEEEFGIRFSIEKIAAWPLREQSGSTVVLLMRLKKAAPLRDEQGRYDLVLGLTGQRVDVYGDGRARVDRIGSCQEGLGNYVIVAISVPVRPLKEDSNSEIDTLALIHELGHILGAEHTNDRESIMHKDFSYRTGFDQKNREIILKNKLCAFAQN